MTRIIGGVAGGRRLATPTGRDTRPTSDRVREAVFSAIESWCGSMSGLRVLDLYAGSGALGLEAWSRGAEAVTLVESDRRTAALVSANARDLGCRVAHVVAAPVAVHLARGPGGAPYDLVLSDPPYPLGEDAVAADLAALLDHGWLAPDSLVVLERSRRSPEPSWPAGLADVRGRKYGETTVWFAHHRGDQPAGPADGPASPPEPPIR